MADKKDIQDIIDKIQASTAGGQRFVLGEAGTGEAYDKYLKDQEMIDDILTRNKQPLQRLNNPNPYARMVGGLDIVSRRAAAVPGPQWPADMPMPYPQPETSTVGGLEASLPPFLQQQILKKQLENAIPPQQQQIPQEQINPLINAYLSNIYKTGGR